MYMRNSSKKRKYLIVKLFGTRSCDGSLYVCSCRYNGCIYRRDVHIIERCGSNVGDGQQVPVEVVQPPRQTDRRRRGRSSTRRLSPMSQQQPRRKSEERQSQQEPRGVRRQPYQQSEP